MIYELHNSFNHTLCAVGQNADWSFPLHAHRGFEFIMVTDGEMEITIDRQNYICKKNEAVLVFPNQIHSLKNLCNSKDIFCTFSKDLTNYFSVSHHHELPKSNFFKVDPEWEQRILRLKTEESMNMVKSILYHLVDDFDRQAEYVEIQDKSLENLVAQIFHFISKNYTNDCSLISLASHLNYNSEYLSRIFKNYCGISYNDYVNQVRVEEACRLLQTCNLSITDISMNCGYSSIRSFNRNFKKIVGMTPQEYLNLHNV